MRGSAIMCFLWCPKVLDKGRVSAADMFEMLTYQRELFSQLLIV